MWERGFEHPNPYGSFRVGRGLFHCRDLVGVGLRNAALQPIGDERDPDGPGRHLSIGGRRAKRALTDVGSRGAGLQRKPRRRRLFGRSIVPAETAGAVRVRHLHLEDRRKRVPFR